ncbi:hypothetical protein GF376_04210 [Candidatus Peregrinibacteria bacterium]|nr:hypothetical protein [Candidatus Peregrinibacteria bacterium]
MTKHIKPNVLKFFKNLTLNNITAFLIGFFIAASYFMLMMKYLNLIGVIIALLSGFALNHYLHKRIPKHKNIHRIGNMGFFTFNLIMLITGFIIIVFVGIALQVLID